MACAIGADFFVVMLVRNVCMLYGDDVCHGPADVLRRSSAEPD